MNESGTWDDLVRLHFPDATEAERHSLLWSCTAFPFAKPEHIEGQLQNLRHKANSPADAIAISAGEFDREWEEGRAERDAWEAEWEAA